MAGTMHGTDERDRRAHGHPEGAGATFGAALAGALRAKGITQHRLGRALGIGQSTISAWVADRATPSHSVVFRVEAALEVAPGSLSRHLGYLPLDGSQPATVLDCIDADPALNPGQRAALRAVYLELTRLAPESGS
jgi:transcriptional regulator with XRE-family HTH domain